MARMSVVGWSWRYIRREHRHRCAARRAQREKMKTSGIDREGKGKVTTGPRDLPGMAGRKVRTHSRKWHGTICG